MKKFMALVIVALVGSANAYGADMPTPYAKAPAMAPAYSWSGWYAGVNVGAAWSKDGTTWNANPAAYGVAFTPVLNAAGTGTINKSGATVGGQIGFNYQFSPMWLAGLEADIGYTDLSKARTTVVPPPGVLGTFVTSTFESKWLATVRGRVGIIAAPSLLLYGTGGVAFADVKTSDFAFFAADGSINAASSKTTRTGWTAGGGAEWQFSANWSAKVEYLYVDLGRVNYTSPNTFTPAATINHDHRVTENLLRVGFNYRFGGPVVARY